MTKHLFPIAVALYLAALLALALKLCLGLALGFSGWLVLIALGALVLLLLRRIGSCLAPRVPRSWDEE